MLTEKEKVSIYKNDKFNFLLANGPDLISKHLRSGKAWEPETLQISKKLIEGIKSPILIDIGANLGAWSVPMASWVKNQNGIVHSFEPQRPVFYQLCANLLCNNLMNCYAHNVAVGDFTGIIDIPILNIFEHSNLGALSLSENIRQQQMWVKNTQPKEPVKITTLDDLNIPKSHLIKIDVEGLELEVLKGGKNWIKQSENPPIILEIWGDYMKEMIQKKKKLLSFIQDELEYDIKFEGEICICQHSGGNI